MRPDVSKFQMNVCQNRRVIPQVIQWASEAFGRFTNSIRSFLSWGSTLFLSRKKAHFQSTIVKGHFVCIVSVTNPIASYFGEIQTQPPWILGLRVSLWKLNLLVSCPMADTHELSFPSFMWFNQNLAMIQMTVIQTTVLVSSEHHSVRVSSRWSNSSSHLAMFLLRTILLIWFAHSYNRKLTPQ